MSRCRSRTGSAVTATILALLAAPASAQTPSAIQKLTLPVVALDLPVSNLDESVTIRADRVALKSDVLFAFDSARLSRTGLARVADAADEVRRRRSGHVSVVGHSDSKGSSGYNLRLSRRRARAVATRLRSLLGGPRTPKITTRGRGETQPVAANTTRKGKDDPRGRARNRRVELVLGRR